CKAAVHGARAGVVRHHVAAHVAGFAVDQVLDSYRYWQGSIERSEYRRRSMENATTTAGSAAAGVAGAWVGTLIAPGVGTAAGGMVGSIVGASGVQALAQQWMTRRAGERSGG